METARDFNKVQEFFKCLGDDDKPFDLDAFYDKKSSMLAFVLNHYKRMRESLGKSLGENFFSYMPIIEDNLSSVEMSNKHGERISSYEEVLIALYKNILANDVDPRHDDWTTLEIYLIALSTFYSKIRPEKIPLETLLEFDQLILGICIVLTMLTVSSPPVLAEIVHSESVKDAKKKQKESTRGEILEAYKSTGARWIDESKKPITVGEESFSINGFARKKIIFQARVNLDQKTVVHHLKSLKKDGNI